MKYLKRILSFNSSRHRLRDENAAFANLIPDGSLVLDAGAGKAQYRTLFDHARYESADFEQLDKKYASNTYVCDLKDIPVEDSRFDFIVFNQVMEHVPDPVAVLSELNRVLKPGGKMLYSGPLFYEEHQQPYDYYRYTQFGLRHLFSATGFSIERMDWLEGYYGTVGYQLNCMARYLPLNPRDLGGGIVGYTLIPVLVILKILFGACSILFYKLDLQVKFKGQGYPKNYIAIISRKHQAADGKVE
jgi:SAM-dependent methyltransferase